MKLFKYITAILLTTALLPVFASTPKNTVNVSSYKSRMKLMNEFKSMYEHKHMQKYLFDVKNGYLLTSVGGNSDKMPLNFYIEYSNMWWDSIIDSVNVPSVGYNPKTQTGFIILNIYYDKTHIFRGMEYVKFKGNKINRIRTYASPAFFSANKNNPLVKLDSYGNEIFLTTGYSLNYSVKAALFFLKSPVARSLNKYPQTAEAMKKIKKRLTHYLNAKKQKA